MEGLKQEAQRLGRELADRERSLSMHLLHAESGPPHLVEDLVGGLDPLKEGPAFVVRLDVGEDRVAQLGDARVGSALERLLGQQSKESLHEVQPRRVGRREVKLETWIVAGAQSTRGPLGTPAMRSVNTSGSSWSKASDG